MVDKKAKQNREDNYTMSKESHNIMEHNKMDSIKSNKIKL